MPFLLTPSLFSDIPHYLSKIDTGMGPLTLLGGDLMNVPLDQVFGIPSFCNGEK